MIEDVGSPRARAAALSSSHPERGDVPDGKLFATIDRSTLSSQACEQIRDRIVEGRLAPGTRVAEAGLASQLGISRTPLHEAMLMLSHEGLVEPLGRKGWLVAPLTRTAARELYPVLTAIECLAFETLGSLAPEALASSRQLVDRFTADGVDPKHRLALERQWHVLVTEQCPNRTAGELAASMVTRVFRYEMVLARHSRARLPSELERVTNALGNGNLSGAKRFIETHWRDRSELVLDAVPELGTMPASSD